MAYTVLSQNNSVTTLEDDQGNVIRVPAIASLSKSSDYTIIGVKNSKATLEDGNGKVHRDIPCVVILADDSSNYTKVSQNNTKATLENTDGNVINVPSKVILATATDYTLVKVNNSTATLEDASGNIIRDVPCVSMLSDESNTISTLNNSTASLLDGNGKTINDIPCIVILAKVSGAITVIIKGVSPLVLPDAIADSLSYVKAFGGTEQRNLPDNYSQRQFIYMMDGSYLLTDIVPTYDFKVEMDFQTTTLPSASVYFFGGRTETYGGLFFARTTNAGFIVDAFGARYNSNISASDNTRYKFTYDNQVAKVESAGTTLFTNTFTGTDATGAAFCINGLNTNGTITTTNTGIYLYSFKVWNGQGELVADYVPAIQRGTVPVVGFYDTVSGTFKTATAGTFAAGGEAVPSPDAPMDIVSNNGALKARHQSGLPLGYTALEYIQSDGASYLIVPYRVNNKTVFYARYNEIQNGPQNANAVFGVTDSPDVSKANNGILRLTGANYNRMGWGNSISGSIIDLANAPKVFDTWYEVLYDQNKLYQDGTLYATSATDPSTVWSANYGLGIFARNSSSITMPAIAKISSVWAKENGEYKINLVPVKRNSDNVLGMYDLVSGQFFTNQGTGDFTAGTAVSDPVEIYTDGTVETIEDTIGNTATAEMLLKVGDYQDVQEILAGDVTRKVGVYVFDGTEIWGVTSSLSTDTYTVFSRQLVMPTKAIRESVYCTHFYGKSLQAAIDNIGQMAFNPIEQYANICYISMDKSIYGTDASAVKQFFKDQYDAGTPVIVIYPLATETTESVAGQTLQVTDGDNTLEITQASLNNLELEAEYQAAVSLTIQEVQDANLDPNVQVTIN